MAERKSPKWKLAVLCIVTILATGVSGCMANRNEPSASGMMDAINKQKQSGAEAARAEMMAYLEERYEETFIFHTLSEPAGVKGLAYRMTTCSERYPNDLFLVSLFDDGTIRDQYAGVLVGKDIDRIITEMAAPYFPEVIVNASGVNSPHFDGPGKDITYEKMREVVKPQLTIDVYIGNAAEIDVEAACQEIYAKMIEEKITGTVYFTPLLEGRFQDITDEETLYRIPHEKSKWYKDYYYGFISESLGNTQPLTYKTWG